MSNQIHFSCFFVYYSIHVIFYAPRRGFPGINATTKHNALVKYIFDLCGKAGIPCEREPRAFSTWRCGECGTQVPPENKAIHEKTCKGRQYYRSGLDLVVFWNTGEIFYDLSVVHELSSSNQNKTCTKLLQDVIARKNETYVATGMIPDYAFQCLPVLSCGSLHQNTRFVLHALANSTAMLKRC